jgi:hypothetical protein
MMEQTSNLRFLEKSVCTASCESPHTVIGNYAPNFQLRSEAHIALTAPLVLHHRIGKCAMKILGINSQLRTELFLILILHPSLVKAMVNAFSFVNCVKSVLPELAIHNGVNKTFPFLHFLNLPKAEQGPCALANCRGVEILKFR